MISAIVFVPSSLRRLTFAPVGLLGWEAGEAHSTSLVVRIRSSPRPVKAIGILDQYISENAHLVASPKRAATSFFKKVLCFAR